MSRRAYELQYYIIIIYIYVHRHGATPARAGRLGETVENVNFYFVIFPNARHDFVHVYEFKVLLYLNTKYIILC